MRRLLAATALAAAVSFPTLAACSSDPITASSGSNVEKKVEIVEGKTLPLVDGGDPNNPIVESQADADPRTPVVEKGPMVKSWGELEQQLGNNQEYVGCMNRSVPLNWVTDVPTFKATEAQNFETRFITVLNSTIGKDRAKQLLKEAGATNVDNLEVELRPDAAVVNTRGFKDGRPGCEEFGDKRPQIRLSLGKVKYENGRPVGLIRDRGIFVGCKNGWHIAAEMSSTSIPKPPTTIPPTCKTECVVTTTQPPCRVDCVPTTTLPPKKSFAPPPGQESPVNNPPHLEPPPTSKATPLQPTPPGQPTQPPPTTPRSEPPPPPPPSSEPTTPFDPCNPWTPACG